MPKLIGRKRKLTTGDILGVPQMKRKVTRKLGFSPWTGKVNARKASSTSRRKARGCGTSILVLVIGTAVAFVLASCGASTMPTIALKSAVGATILTEGLSTSTTEYLPTRTPQPTETKKPTLQPTDTRPPTSTPLPTTVVPTTLPTVQPTAVPPTAQPTQPPVPTAPPTAVQVPTPVPTQPPPPPPTEEPPPPAEPTQPPPPAPAQVIIAGVYNSGKVEHVRIKNVGGSDADLSGWAVTGSKGDDRYVFPGGYVLPAGQEMRLHSGEGGVSNPPWDIYWTTKNVWNNDGETVFLWTATGELADEYTY